MQHLPAGGSGLGQEGRITQDQDVHPTQGSRGLTKDEVKRLRMMNQGTKPGHQTREGQARNDQRVQGEVHCGHAKGRQFACDRLRREG